MRDRGRHLPLWIALVYDLWYCTHRGRYLTECEFAPSTSPDIGVPLETWWEQVTTDLTISEHGARPCGPSSVTVALLPSSVPRKGADDSREGRGRSAYGWGSHSSRMGKK